ncbi:MAG: type II toxin-antitoxin system VapC family toxin [Acidobacteriales bacterium]|nr:type II toxin-antitoxin system VapC family toxin [Terriglobales bacterium]
MKCLLDTGVFLLARASPHKLNRRARQLILQEREDLFLSAVSSWEISIKYALGRLRLPAPPSQYVPASLADWGIEGLEITHRHALAAGELPLNHHDPFDRMLIVQAQLEQLVLLTADRIFEKYDVRTLWCGL